MRTVPHPLGTRDLKRLINLVIKIHLPTIRVIQEFWGFECTNLWEVLDVFSRFSELRPQYVFFFFREILAMELNECHW